MSSSLENACAERTVVSIDDSQLELSASERTSWADIGDGSRAVVLTSDEIKGLMDCASSEFDAGAATRLRAIVNRLGASAPESDVDMMGALCSVLGNVNRALDALLPMNEPRSVVRPSIDQAPPESKLKSILDKVAGPVSARDRDIITLARQMVAREGEIEIDDSSIVSEGDDNGAYVLAWAWCSFQDTPLDKTVD
ncbi:hypothetical protein [Burkholderia territorii]|uniref:hypothetical protein n=1 Tax=Burkholderia territorii TaxID=1503055 RepID=UPI000A8E055C|nr:hypothetical protein [Burkholderia territorii]